MDRSDWHRLVERDRERIGASTRTDGTASYLQMKAECTDWRGDPTG